MESLRQESVVHEIDVVQEDEFPSISRPRPTADQAASPDLAATLELLWGKRNVLGRIALWALLISTAIAFLIPRKYDSAVRIMPPDSQGDTGMMLAALAGKTGIAPGGLASLAGSVLGMKNTGALFVDLLHSRTVEDHIVDRFDLQKVYWQHYKQDARATLDDRTDTKEDRKSGVITIVVRDRSPERAHDIAQAYVDELDSLVARVSTSAARRERIFIEQRLVTVKHDLEQAENEFSSFASKNATLDIKEQTRAMVESAAVLQGQLIAAQSEAQSLEQIYTPNNVRVRSAQARINELKRQLQKMSGSDESLAAGAVTSKDDLYPSIRKLPLLGVEWADLYRTAKIQETVFELLNQQYEMARIQEAKEIPTVRVIDPPEIPEKKAFPPRLLIIVLLTGISLLAFSSWLVGRERAMALAEDHPRRQVINKIERGMVRVQGHLIRYRLALRSHGNGTKNGNS
jgi:capsule polysaccharide export protein KpsE/RkpR